jgi:SAM-dependent methyltransferase
MRTLIYALAGLQFILLFSAIFIVFYCGYMVLSFRNILPFVPSVRSRAREMAKLAAVKAGDRVIDLGSGTGTLLLALAAAYPNNQFVGYEISPFLIAIARMKICLRGFRKRVKIKKEDFFQLNLTAVDVIVCYITNEAFRKLWPQLVKMKIGSRIVSNEFRMPANNYFREEIVHSSKKKRGNIYLYTKFA